MIETRIRLPARPTQQGDDFLLAAETVNAFAQHGSTTQHIRQSHQRESAPPPPSRCCCVRSAACALVIRHSRFFCVWFIPSVFFRCCPRRVVLQDTLASLCSWRRRALEITPDTHEVASWEQTPQRGTPPDRRNYSYTSAARVILFTCCSAGDPDCFELLSSACTGSFEK